MALTPSLATATGLGSSGTLTATYLSAVDLLNTFEVETNLLDRYSTFGGSKLMNFMEDQGNYELTAQDVYYHGEKNWLYLAQKISAVAVGTAGTGTAGSVNITIDPTSIDGVPAVRVTDLLMFAGNVQGYVTAVNTTTGVIAVQPQAGMTAAALVIVAAVGTYFSILSNAQIQGSSNIESYKSKPLMFQGNVQIFREAFTANGSAMSNESYFTSKGGKPYYYLTQEVDAAMRLRLKIEMGLLYNNAGSFSDTTGGGNAVAVSQGLIPLIQQDGINYATSVGGQFGITDFEQLNLAMDAENAGSEVNFWVGNELAMQVQNSLTNSMKEGAVTYGAFGAGGKERAIELGFDSIRLGQRTFHIQTLGSLYHPQITALPGMNNASTGFILPTDKMVDTVSGSKTASVKLRFKKQGDGTDRRYRFGKINFDINLKDETTTGYMAEVGLQVMGRNRLAYIQA